MHKQPVCLESPIEALVYSYWFYSLLPELPGAE